MTWPVAEVDGTHGNNDGAEGVADASASASASTSTSTVVASTCSSGEIVSCVQHALDRSRSRSSGGGSGGVPQRLALCCLGALPTGVFGKGNAGRDRVIDWVDQRLSAPLLTELTPAVSLELLQLDLPFVILYLPGITSKARCDTGDAPPLQSGNGIDEGANAGTGAGSACRTKRYAAVRAAQGSSDLLDVYEQAAARFSFGDAAETEECWDSVVLGLETPEQCIAESKRQLVFTWAPGDTHPNKTSTAALNIADYHTCKRYDFKLSAALAHRAAGDRDTRVLDEFFSVYLNGEVGALFIYLLPCTKAVVYRHALSLFYVCALVAGFRVRGSRRAFLYANRNTFWLLRKLTKSILNGGYRPMPRTCAPKQ